MPIDLLSMKDPLLKGVDPARLHAFDPVKASSHISRWNLRKYTHAQIFVADGLVKYWGKLMGGAHLLTDERMEAVVRALAEFTPKQIASAITAYAKHCRTDPERARKPWMRKTFERLFKDGLETWVAVGGQSTQDDDKARRHMADVRDHQEFMSRWSQIPPERQSELLRRAGARRPSLSPMLSNPLFRAELRKLMPASTGLSKSSRPDPTPEPRNKPANAGPTPDTPDLVTVEQLHAHYDALDAGEKQRLLEKAERRLLASGKYAGRPSMAVPMIRTKVYQILQQQIRAQAAKGVPP